MTEWNLAASHLCSLFFSRWRSTRPWTWLSRISRTTWCAVAASTTEPEFTCPDATQVECWDFFCSQTLYTSTIMCCCLFPSSCLSVFIRWRVQCRGGGPVRPPTSHLQQPSVNERARRHKDRTTVQLLTTPQHVRGGRFLMTTTCQ